MDTNKKIKMLIYADTPSCATGFSKVIQGIFKNLAETGKYDITIFGINDRGGWKDQKEYPYKIYPTMDPGSGDVYGRMKLISIISGRDNEIRPPWDIIFTLNDPFIFEYPMQGFEGGLMEVIQKVLYKLYRETTPPENWFKLVSYWPVDSPLKGNWIDYAVALPNYNVAYTKYGKSEIEKANNLLVTPHKLDIKTIYHGVDTKDFFPISESEKAEFKKKFFANKVNPETFVVTCVARNQMRKDLPRVMKIFREFQKRRPDSVLYLHSKPQDVFGSLLELARMFNLEPGKDFFFPKNFNENTGFPITALNCIYNISDVYLTATLGEGWALPVTEAMAVKKVVLAPNITSIQEIFGTEGNNIEDVKELETNESIRGIPLKSGSTTSEWACYGIEDLERMRPLTNVDDAVKKLMWVYDNPEKAAKIAERGYNWVQQYTWKNIANEWDNLFQQVYKDLEKERGEAKNAIKATSSKPDSGKSSESKRDDSRAVPEVKEAHGDDEKLSFLDSNAKKGEVPLT